MLQSFIRSADNYQMNICTVHAMDNIHASKDVIIINASENG